MNKFFSPFIIIGVAILFLSFIPQVISAAEITFKVVPNTEIHDNTMIIEVRIDPQSKKINVVEGTVSFSGTMSDDLLVQVENGQSVLPLWPTLPEYIKDKKVIHFVGGVPDGFDSEGLLFRVHLSLPISGNLVISYINGSAYLNDGKGTKEKIYSKPFNINLDKNENNKLNETLPSFKGLKNVTIILLIAVLFIFSRYGYKKIIKK